MSNSNAHGSQISDQNEALRRENADLYAQIKALSQRLAQGSAGEFAAAACLHCRVSRSRAWSLEPRPGGTIHRGQRRPPLTSRLGESSGPHGTLMIWLVSRAGLSTGAGGGAAHARGAHVSDDGFVQGGAFPHVS
jgi:hypothetical protein